MERSVTITIKVDPTEYEDTEDTVEGVLELVEDMLLNRADLPETVTLICEGKSHKVTP